MISNNIKNKKYKKFKNKENHKKILKRTSVLLQTNSHRMKKTMNSIISVFFVKMKKRKNFNIDFRDICEFT